MNYKGRRIRLFPALILYKNNIQQEVKEMKNTATYGMALILYKNNIQRTYEKLHELLIHIALILYKNNIQHGNVKVILTKPCMR